MGTDRRLGAIARIGIGGISITGLLRSRRIKQLARPRYVVGGRAIGKQAVVTDAVETAGQSPTTSIITLARSRPLAR